ncbi:uncharacterized protein [Pleurodeles waltl]|uniref:uncharacterized protein isoform X2 n=1 Tax=Pleurodeles waltl TaxID=8319 RepID=UPI0037094E6B
MAVVGPVRELQDETVCPLCTKYFEDPVAIDCDHSYCRACITGHWQTVPTGAFVCPQCGQAFSRMNLRTNVQLSVMVKIAKSLNFAPEKTERRPPVQQRPRVRSVEFNLENNFAPGRNELRPPVQQRPRVRSAEYNVEKNNAPEKTEPWAPAQQRPQVRSMEYNREKTFPPEKTELRPPVQQRPQVRSMEYNREKTFPPGKTELRPPVQERPQECPGARGW